jgi:hypothetical protein
LEPCGSAEVLTIGRWVISYQGVCPFNFFCELKGGLKIGAQGVNLWVPLQFRVKIDARVNRPQNDFSRGHSIWLKN